MTDHVWHGRVCRRIRVAGAAEKDCAMKHRLPIVIAAVALLAVAVSATRCAAMPAAALSAVSVETPIQQVNGVRHHYHHYRYRLRLPLLEVYPGLYYDCRPGWYCFGPPLRPYFTRGWYGGFNSIYGYQGARWRPPRRNTGS
jgi:hypothetical protein